MSSFLQEELMDHYRFPRNRGQLETPDFAAHDENPSCGDRIGIQGNVKDNTVSELCFDGKGCILSQAATSMLVDGCRGKTLEELSSLSREDILAMVGVKVGPVRAKCALLCLDVLRKGINSVSSSSAVVTPEPKRLD